MVFVGEAGISVSATSQQPITTSLVDGLSIQINEAPVAKRILAYLIDLGIVTGAMYVAFIVGCLAVAMLAGILKIVHATALIIPIAVFLLLSLLSAASLYFVYYEYKFGRTIGKRTMGLRILSLDGTRLTLSQCVMRDLARYVDCLLIFPGLLCIAATRHRQRLGDLMANTVVVYSKREESGDQFLYIGQERYELLVEELYPRNIEEELSRKYLRYAFLRFIRGEKSLDDHETERAWLDTFSAFCNQERFSKLAPEEALRFFAEWCLKEKKRRERA